jgi:hypothetical protein
VTRPTRTWQRRVRARVDGDSGFVLGGVLVWSSHVGVGRAGR